MKTIWKFKVPFMANPIPIQAAVTKFLTAQVQKDTICVWAEVDTEKPENIYLLILVSTGDNIPENGEYIGTIQDKTESYVFHVYASKYERPKEESEDEYVQLTFEDIDSESYQTYV